MPEYPAPTPTHALAIRLARLVFQARAESTAAGVVREEARAIAKRCQKRTVTLGLDDGGTLLVCDSPLTAADEAERASLALLASRLVAYGVESVTLGKGVAEADVQELVRLLAAEPPQEDPAEYFEARSVALDSRTMPRRLRARPPAEQVPPPTLEPASALEPASGPVAEPLADPAADMAEDSSPDPRSERLAEALPLPNATNADLAALLASLQSAQDVEAVRPLVDAAVARADSGFRTGDFDQLVDALAGLVAVEYGHLERDASDEWRRIFGQAVRRLGTPMLLRQLAVTRHRRVEDPIRTRQVQAILHRYGTDGADALIDEWASAPTLAARGTCLEALRALRRTHDALFALLRDTREAVVRQAVGVLGALGDKRSEALLLEQIRHPEARTRRDVVAALERFASVASLDALGLAMLDESSSVRLRAVAALAHRGAVAVRMLAPALDVEADREVLYAAVAALGAIGTPEAVQLLIRCAQGETSHPRKRSPSYRLQACAALVRVRSPQSMTAVQGLRDDRDREVREGAMRLVAQAVRRGTTAIRAIPAP